MYILYICIYSYRPAQHLLFTVFPETDQRFQGEDWMEFYLKSNHQLDKGQGPKWFFVKFDIEQIYYVFNIIELGDGLPL